MGHCGVPSGCDTPAVRKWLLCGKVDVTGPTCPLSSLPYVFQGFLKLGLGQSVVIDVFLFKVVFCLFQVVSVLLCAEL